MAGTTPKHEANYPVVYWTLVALYALIAIAALVLAIFGLNGINRTLVILIVGLYSIFCIAPLSKEYLWGVLALEYPIMVWGGGAIFLPFNGLLKSVRVPRTALQRQFPGEPSAIFHQDDRVDLPPGMVRPIRVVSGAPISGYESLLNIQMGTKVTGTVRYRIDPKFFWDFWFGIRGATLEDKIHELERQMEDTWSKTVTAEFEIRPIGKVIEEGATIRDNIKTALDKAVEEWGVDVLETTLYSPDLSHDLAKKLEQIGEENAAAVAQRTRADASAYTTRQEGQAKADAEYARRKAEGDGVAYQAEKMGVDGETIFAGQTAERVFSDKTTFVFGLDGIKDIFKAGTAGKKG